MSKRDPIRIMFDLLRTARENDGISKTQLVRRTNLSFHSINSHLSRLQTGDFIRNEFTSANETDYRLTEEGERLYRILNELYKLLDRQGHNGKSPTRIY